MDRRAFFSRIDQSSSLKKKTRYARKNEDLFGLNRLFSSSAVAEDSSDLAAYTLDKINRNFTSGLSEYTTPLTYDQVSHLFKRTCFNASANQIQSYVGQTAGNLVDMLFSEYALPDDTTLLNPAEVQPDNTQPNYNATGAFLSGGPYTAMLDMQREVLVNKQWNDAIIGSPINIREKMVVFLSTYLVVQEATIADVRLFHGYLVLLRSFCTAGGLNWNFKKLIEQLSIHPSMLVYLNGNGSTAGSPNENYGRELQELFTIGKGTQVGDGDYTNYSEADVQTAARLFTGWVVDGYQATDNGMGVGAPIQARFIPAQHDPSNKQFSSDYQNKVIPGNAADGTVEINAMIDMIFGEPATALTIVSRLYRTFVYYSIDAMSNNNTMANIVTPLANQFASNGFDMQAVLKTLLKSQHFFDPLNVGCVIKDPVTFVAGAMRNIGITSGDIMGPTANLQMQLGQPSEVAGWKGTYEGPNYFEWWISTITVDARTLFTNGPNTADGGFVKGNIEAFVTIIKNHPLIPDPSDPNVLITGLAKIMFPYGLTSAYPGPITSTQLTLLKGILLPGLPDFEWNAQIWAPAQAGDTDANAQLRAHLIDLLHYMCTMAEYYLC